MVGKIGYQLHNKINLQNLMQHDLNHKIYLKYVLLRTHKKNDIFQGLEFRWKTHSTLRLRITEISIIA